MRYIVTAIAVLVLTLTLVHVGISRMTDSAEMSLKLKSNGLGAHAAVGLNSTSLPVKSLTPQSAKSAQSTRSAPSQQRSWIGDHARVVLNRIWRLDSDLNGRIILAAAEGAAGEPSNSASLADLADQARELKGTFQPIAPADLTSAQSDLKAKVDRLGWRLSGQGADEKTASDAWKAILHWDELQTAVNQGNEVKPEELRRLARIVRDAQSSETLDRRDDEGAQSCLDFRTALQDVGVALHRYRLLLIAAGPNGTTQFDLGLDALAKAFSGNPATWNSAESFSVGRLLGDLQAERQAPALVQAIHERFSQPNLVIHAPAAFIAKLSEQDPVDETNNDFKDNILDTNTVGSTHIQGQKTVTLIPNNQQAVLGITFNGTVMSQTVGYHSPVTVSSHGTTQLHGVVYVTINGDGFTSGRACSHACTHTRIDCIAVCGGRLVQRIAPKRVYKSKPEAECIAGEHAEQRLSERIQSDATESLGKSNRNYQSKMRDPLMSWGAFPRIRYATTSSELTVSAVEANSFQLASPIAVAPPAADGNSFLAMRLHQSFVNNLLALSLGGRTVSQAQFENGVGNLLGPEAAAKARKSGESNEQIREREAKMTDAEREDFEQKLKFMKANRKITFTEDDPVTVEFTDHAFSITIRGTRFEGEDLERPAGAENITARYKFDDGPNGPQRATRVGELEIAPPAWRKLSPLQRSTLRTAEVDKLRGRFNDLLPPTIEFQGLDFSQSAQPWNKIGALQAYRVTSGDGWLAIDWKEAQ